ncbi:MAG: tetratricopeptide repeat protein [Longimicrobiales bacterium]
MSHRPDAWQRHPLILLGAAALVVYALALTNGFAYDDVVIVKGDVRVTQFQFHEIVTRPYWSSPGFALYRPLVTLSFALDWAISHGHAAWFHAVNAIWHALATVALYVFLKAWFRTGPALVAALVFAVHPVHVEAVANVVGRAELMAATLFLLACALWAHERPRYRPLRVAIVALLYAAAVLCKENAATLPAILLLIDAARGKWTVPQLRQRLRARAVDYGVLLVVLAGLIGLRAVLAGGATPAQLDPVMEVTQATGDRLRSALQIWPHIVRLLLYPNELLADYGPRVLMPAAGWTPLVLLGLFMAATLTLGGLLLFDRGQALGALIMLWLPITLLPVANLLFPIGVMLAERTLYLPSVAVSLGLALLLAQLQREADALPRWSLAVCALVLLFCVVRVQMRIPDWDSTDSIMLAQRRDRPESFRAEWHAARMARRDGQSEVAIQRYQHAVRLWPYRERLIVESAAYLSQQRALLAALRVAGYGAEKWPRNLQLQRLLASNALDLGDTTTARKALAAGLRIDPRDALLLRMSATLNPGKAAHE